MPSLTGVCICNFCHKVQKFSLPCYQGGQYGGSVNDAIKLADPEKSCSFVQESRTYFLHKPSYGRFCVHTVINIDNSQCHGNSD